MSPPAAPGAAPGSGTERWLIRHGESAWSREHRFQGVRDALLPDVSRLPADEAGDLPGPERAP